MSDLTFFCAKLLPTVRQQFTTHLHSLGEISSTPNTITAHQLDAEQALLAQSLADIIKVDYTALPPLHARDFSLLAMDMDSTLITIECIDEIADLCGLKPQVAAITEAAMRGEIDYPQSLVQRVALLKGLPYKALQRVYNERLKFSPGAHELIAFAKAQGWKTLLVSGGFTFFTEQVKTELGLDYAYANTLEVADDKLTGRVVGTVVDAQEKARIVQATCAALGVSAQRAIAMGDGANDLAMMAVAGLSVAYRAKPRVREAAKLAINHGGLDALTYCFSAS
jgi:phosphoserine phosphatase